MRRCPRPPPSPRRQAPLHCVRPACVSRLPERTTWLPPVRYRCPHRSAPPLCWQAGSFIFTHCEARSIESRHGYEGKYSCRAWLVEFYTAYVANNKNVGKRANQCHHGDKCQRSEERSRCGDDETNHQRRDDTGKVSREVKNTAREAEQALRRNVGNERPA